MERLDKIISNYSEYSRREIKNLIRQERVKVNNEIIQKSNIKIDLDNSQIYIDNEELKLLKNIYMVLNKPKGYITATEDKQHYTVLDLISNEYKVRNIFPVGRLDKDTTGLLILTNDGKFAHNITSPKKDIIKIYEAQIDIQITEQMILGFKEGIVLKDGKCKSSKLEKMDKYTALVTITEGRYHQIKRMFGVFRC